MATLPLASSDDERLQSRGVRLALSVALAAVILTACGNTDRTLIVTRRHNLGTVELGGRSINTSCASLKLSDTWTRGIGPEVVIANEAKDVIAVSTRFDERCGPGDTYDLRWTFENVPTNERIYHVMYRGDGTFATFSRTRLENADWNVTYTAPPLEAAP
jgi:hypothetical protein